MAIRRSPSPCSTDSYGASCPAMRGDRHECHPHFGPRYGGSPTPRLKPAPGLRSREVSSTSGSPTPTARCSNSTTTTWNRPPTRRRCKTPGSGTSAGSTPCWSRASRKIPSGTISWPRRRSPPSARQSHDPGRFLKREARDESTQGRGDEDVSGVTAAEQSRYSEIRKLIFFL